MVELRFGAKLWPLSKFCKLLQEKKQKTKKPQITTFFTKESFPMG